MEYLNSLSSDVIEINIKYGNLKLLPNLSRFTRLQKLDCHNNKIEDNSLEYHIEQTKNRKMKLQLLKEKSSARKIQRIWRKYWYDFYKYELVDGKYIGFCRFIEKSYFIINGSSI